MKKNFLCLLICMFIISCHDKIDSLEEDSWASTRSQIDMVEEEPEKALIEKPKIFPYTVNVGSEEWKNMSWTEKEQACQLPTEFIDGANSHDLAMACIEYPMAFAYTFYMDTNPFITSLLEKNNGFASLVKRNDGYMELAKIYESLELSEYASEYMYNQSSVLIYPFIELLLGHESIISKFSQEELKWLKRITVGRYADKLANPDVYGLLNIESSMMLFATIILRDGTPITDSERELLNLLFDNPGSGIYAEDFERIAEIITDKSILL